MIFAINSSTYSQNRHQVKAGKILGLSFVLFLGISLSLGAAEPAQISISVDASEVNQQRIEARLVIPAKPGPLTLLYPKWLPGTHGPGGPIGHLGGLKLS